MTHVDPGARGEQEKPTPRALVEALRRAAACMNTYAGILSANDYGVDAAERALALRDEWNALVSAWDATESR